VGNNGVLRTDEKGGSSPLGRHQKEMWGSAADYAHASSQIPDGGWIKNATAGGIGSNSSSSDSSAEDSESSLAYFLWFRFTKDICLKENLEA
jgi:hypothetical protein